MSNDDSTEIDLKNHRDLVKAYFNAKELQRFHEGEAEKYAKAARDIADRALAKVFGDATDGYLDGKLVLRRRQTTQFASARFAKDYPDLAKEFEEAELKYVIDTGALELAEPDLYKKYLTTRWYDTPDG